MAGKRDAGAAAKPRSAPPKPARHKTQGSDNNWLLWLLLALAAACWMAYAALALLSPAFALERDYLSRPIPAVVCLLFAAFAVHLAALAVALRAKQGRWLTWLILAPAVLFRATVLPSVPIQEVDIYRYLWDGATLTSGVSPYRYSPQQVREARDSQSLPNDLAVLVLMRDAHPSLATIVSRIEHAQLPTIYPPVSQVVFALSAWTTPDTAGVHTHIVMMKIWLAVFDLLALLLIVRILRMAGLSTAWSIVYGWSPLVLKEFANAGHLDSIPVCLTLLAVHLVQVSGWSDRPWLGGMFAAAAVLGLAVGAKIYPVVLILLLAAAAWRLCSWQVGLGALAISCVVGAVLLWPMWPRHAAPEPAAPGTAAPIPQPQSFAAATAPQDPGRGLTAFLRSWEMNDFWFMLVIENLKSMEALPEGQPKPWFSVLPEGWRAAIRQPVAARVAVANRQEAEFEAAFRITRGLTALVFMIIAATLALRRATVETDHAWLGACFLTLAWFFLLAPTQNPWYWTWALCLVPFARGRAWLALGGLLLIYYLRFWLLYHWDIQYPLEETDETVLGTGYSGALFFDFIVTWLEYLPWYIALAALAYARRRQSLKNAKSSPVDEE